MRISNKQNVAFRVMAVDIDTGEAWMADEDRYDVVDLEQVRRRQAAIEKHKAMMKGASSRMNPDKFIWEIYELSTMRDDGISPANVTRMIYLSTFLGYDGSLVHSNGKPIQYADLAGLLGISDRAFRDFWKEMTAAGVFREKNGAVLVDKDRFRRGRLKDKDVGALAAKGQFLTRLYTNGVRQLYESATPRSHKTLSYMFQILPFVNREHNIVCHNPLETDVDKINRMTLGEFCDLMGYDRDNATRLSKALFEPTFTVKGQEQHAMRYVLATSLKREEYRMFINPNVYYAGSDWKQVEILGAFKG